MLSLAAPLVHAEDVTELAMRNSLQTMQYLHSVPAPEIHRPLAAIEENRFERPAANQPMWIVEILSGTILYYQGQPEFRGQPASRLVDDNGGRFGERAVTFGKASKSAWLRLALGGNSYQAYCKSQYPFVVCTLAM